MSLIWPLALLVLLVLPLLVWLYFRGQHRRQALAARYGALGLAQTAAGRRAGWQRHLPPAAFLLGLSLLLFSLARPQMPVGLPRLEGTVLLAFDVSGSMAATDMKPTRMEAAKKAAQAFVERQPAGVRIGVVAFSDSGVAVQAPTNDQGQILAALQRLRPERGTSLAGGLTAALEVIAASQTDAPPQYYSNRTPEPTATPTPMPRGTYAPAVIILLSDGENTVAPDPLLAAQAAADRGVRVYAIGVGSAAGADLQIEGFTIHSQLDEAALQQIASITDGAYYAAASEAELAAVYSKITPQLVVRQEQLEVTALFAGAGLLLLLLGGALSLLWFNRLP